MIGKEKTLGFKRWEWIRGAITQFRYVRISEGILVKASVQYSDFSSWHILLWAIVGADSMTYHWAMVIRLGQSPSRQLGQITQSVDSVSRVRNIVTRPWPPPLSLHLLEDTGGELLQAGGPRGHAHVRHGDPEQSLNTPDVNPLY